MTVDDPNEQPPARDAATEQVHRFVWHPPGQGLAVPAAVFAFGSAFPGPGVLAYLRIVRQQLVPGNGLIRVFGHTDQIGRVSSNKRLSDLRAKGVLALLTNDLDGFHALARDDTWGVEHDQAMLRALGCNPGPIDGVAGRLTREAVIGFQKGYNEGAFHRRPGRARQDGELPVRGTLDDRTRRALRESYVADGPDPIDRSAVLGPGFSGCSEFNLTGESDAADRRVVLATFSSRWPTEGEFPCREGNASVCPVDGRRPHRCSFYRKVVREEAWNEAVPPFFDFQWLRERSGAVYLSAVTSISDSTPVRFRVHRCEQHPVPAAAAGWDGGPPVPGLELGMIQGTIRGGIAWARWEPPEGLDPFDWMSWRVIHDFELWNPDFDPDADEEDGTTDPEADAHSAAALLDLKAFEPPVFTIETEAAWGRSDPPGVRRSRVRVEGGADAEGHVLGVDGSLYRFRSSEPPPQTDLDPMVTAVALKASGVEVPSPAEGGVA